MVEQNVVTNSFRSTPPVKEKIIRSSQESSITALLGLFQVKYFKGNRYESIVVHMVLINSKIYLHIFTKMLCLKRRSILLADFLA